MATTSWEELTHWKRLWCWEGLGAGGEGDDRGWDGWMASPTRWTWVWVIFRSWWWTGMPGVLWFMESQRVRHDGQLNWTEPPLVFLPGKVHGQRSLADYRPKGSQELDTTERLTHTYRSHHFYSSTSRHWVWLYSLNLVNYAAMNMGVQISFWAGVLFPQVNSQKQNFWIICSFIFNFLRSLHTAFHSGYLNWLSYE